MQPKAEQHIRKGFGYYDCNVTSAIGECAERVYEGIRRWVWRRGVKPGEPLVASGKHVKQGELAESIGRSRKTVNEAIKTLVEIGWVEMEGPPENVKYILGTYPGNFYADEQVTLLYAALEELAEKEGAVNDSGYPAVYKLPNTTRTEFAREFFKHSNRKAAESRLGKNYTGLGKIYTGPVTNLHRVSDPVTNLHSNNRESIPNRESRIENSPIRPTGGSLATPEQSPPERSEGGPLVLGGAEGSHPNSKTPDKNSARPTHRVKSRGKLSLDEIKALAEQARNKSVPEIEKKRKRAQARELRARNLGGTGKLDYGDPYVRKAINGLQTKWFESLRRNYPDSPAASKWTAANRGKVGELLKLYKRGEVEDMFEYVLDQWSKIREQKKLSPTIPTIGYVLKLHDTFVPEAAKYVKVSSVLREWNAWWDANPHADFPPVELEKRFAAHRKEMEELGLL